MQIQQRVFLITGGASGLGAAVARHLVARGGQVALADLNASAGEQLADQLGPSASFTTTDVTAAQSMQQAVEQCIERHGALHGLVTCAGIAPAARIVARDGPHDLALFERTLQINLTGTFNALRCAAAAMQHNAPDITGERGVALLTSSIAAFEGQTGQAAYAASKAGVAALALPAARELASLGIRVVAIAPGVFDTPLMAAMPPAVRESLEKQTPFPPRFGQGEEFASLVEQAITNVMLNGSVLRIDGALRMGSK